MFVVRQILVPVEDVVRGVVDQGGADFFRFFGQDCRGFGIDGPRRGLVVFRLIHGRVRGGVHDESRTNFSNNSANLVGSCKIQLLTVRSDDIA